jgi:AAA+ superfamily predicted ATPase
MIRLSKQFFASVILIYGFAASSLLAAGAFAGITQEEIEAELASLTPEQRKAVEAELASLTPEQRKAIELELSKRSEKMLSAFADEINDKFNIWVQHVEKLQARLHYAEHIIAQDKNRDPKKLQWIRAVYPLVNKLRKTRWAPLNGVKLTTLFKLINNLYSVVNEAFEKEFNDLPQVLPQKLLEGGEEESSNRFKRDPLGSLTALVESVEKKSKDLDLLVDNIGLTWSNKLFRKIDNAFQEVIRTDVGFYMQFLPFIPPLFSVLMHNGFLPSVLHNKLKSIFYGESIPQFAFKLWPALQIEIDGGHPKGGYRWYARSEISLSQIVGFYLMLQYLRPHLLPKNYNALIDTIPTEVFKFVKEIWGELRGANFSERKELYEVIDDVTLDDERLIGLEHQIESLRQVASYLTDPEKYIRTDTEIAKGIMLVGPSRSGKTFLAKALAGTINQMYAREGRKDSFGFRELKYWELLLPSSFKYAVDDAMRHAPCALFIDEVHLLKLQASGNSALLTEFLTTMNDLYESNDPQKQVFIIAATNQPDSLDSALFQYRRFGKVIRFNTPSYEERKIFFERSISDANDINVELVAYQTAGCSYGDLQKVVNKARMATLNIETLKQRHIQQAIDEEVRHITTNLPLTEPEKRGISIYQAGKALAYHLLQPQQILDVVTIYGVSSKITEIHEYDIVKKRSRDDFLHKVDYGAVFVYEKNETVNTISEDELKKRIQILCAGQIAQELILGVHFLSYRKEDMQNALVYAKTILLNGLMESELPIKAQEELHENAVALLASYRGDIMKQMSQVRDKLENLATVLESRAILTNQEIAEIVSK